MTAVPYGDVPTDDPWWSDTKDDDPWWQEATDSHGSSGPSAGGAVPFVPATDGVVAQVKGDLAAVVGASTVVSLLAPRPVMDLSVSRDWAGYRARWASVPLALVARGTAAGLRAAMEWVAAAAEAGVEAAALVVVADGPWPVPRAVRGRLRLLEGHVGAVVRVPYVTAWRYVDDPLEVGPLPRKVADAVAALDMALDGRQGRRRGWAG